MVAGGGVIAALSNNALGRPTSEQRRECEMYSHIKCTELSPGTLWAGIGVAGAGVTLAILGKARQRSAVTFVPMPGGAAIFRRISF